MGRLLVRTQFDAMGLATLIPRREVMALKVLDEAITRAEKLNPAINAVIMSLHYQARAVARRRCWKAHLPACRPC